jgi:hypothetical protein
LHLSVVGYFETGLPGNKIHHSKPNTTTERTATHQGWNKIGKTITKAMNTTHRHVDASAIYAR